MLKGKKRKSAMSRRASFFALAAIVVGLVGYAYMSVKERNVIADLCVNDTIGETYAKLRSDEDITNNPDYASSLIATIEQAPKHAKSINCVYLITEASIQLYRADQAKTGLSKLQKLFESSNTWVDEKLAPASIESVKNRVDALDDRLNSFEGSII